MSKERIAKKCLACGGDFEVVKSYAGKAKYSRAAVQRVIDGVSGYKTGHVTGTYRGQKAATPVRFKSSWELAAMMYWDRCSDVVSYAYEPDVIMLSSGQRTVPDFCVRYTCGRESIVEIKPSAIQALPTVSLRLEMTRRALKERGVDYAVFGNVEIDAMKREIGDEFDATIRQHQGRV